MTDEQRELLESWVRAKTTPQRVAFRAKICLLAADGMSATEIAHGLNTTRPTVLLWKKRFDEQGPDGVTKDASRGPSPRRLDEQTRQAIMDTTLNSTPPDAAQWTTRTLAKALGVSNATVSRIWKALKIGPKKKKNGKPSKGSGQEPRHAELVGIYLTASVKALVVSVVDGPSRWAFPHRPNGAQGAATPRERLFPDEASACISCLSGASSMLDGAAPAVSTNPSSLDGVLQFLQRATLEAASGAEVHFFIEGIESEIQYLEDRWISRGKRAYIHTFPCGALGTDSIAKVVGQHIGNRPSQEFVGASTLAAAIREFLQIHDGSPVPLVWTKKFAPDTRNRAMCKAMLETLRHMAALIVSHGWTNKGNVHGVEEELMNWKHKLESWFAAVAFAEEGEHKTALDIAATPIPEPSESVRILPSFSTTFAAAAFAEENCHDYAAEILYGVKRTNSFLDAIGLGKVRVWYGTACVEESFAEAVGLVGVQYRLVTIRL